MKKNKEILEALTNEKTQKPTDSKATEKNYALWVNYVEHMSYRLSLDPTDKAVKLETKMAWKKVHDIATRQVEKYTQRASEATSQIMDLVGK